MDKLTIDTPQFPQQLLVCNFDASAARKFVVLDAQDTDVTPQGAPLQGDTRARKRICGLRDVWLK
jgi:hypothetical protein